MNAQFVDASTYELWIPLLNGGTVVLAQPTWLAWRDPRRSNSAPTDMEPQYGRSSTCDRRLVDPVAIPSGRCCLLLLGSVLGVFGGLVLGGAELSVGIVSMGGVELDLESMPLWQRSGEELLCAAREVEMRMRRDYAVLLDLVAELGSRDIARQQGYPSLPELLREVLRISRAEAKRRIGHAKAVLDVALVSGGTAQAPLPHTGQALRAGELGPEHVDTIAKSLLGLPSSVSPERRAWAEGILVQAATDLDPRTLARLGVRLRAELDQDGAPPSDQELAQPCNELRFTVKPNGRLAFRGELDPEASALLQTVLSPLAKPHPSSAEGPDPRSDAERHGDALVEILHLAADTGHLPSQAGEKPHLLVVTTLDTLRDGLQQALLHGAGLLDAATARRLACDCKLIPAVLGTDSEPLDIGRTNYTVPIAIRRALILRDRGCAFPGCHRPHHWCHAHHIISWADGGPTSLDNLALLCGRHHRLIHHSQWQCTITNGHPEFHPPPYIDPHRKPRRNTLHPP